MKVALLFGSFNPIHEGHLAILRYLVERTDADQVRLVVSPESPFKEGRGLLDNAAERLEAARAAVAAAGLTVDISDVEFHLPAPRYTLNTLRHLQQEEPGNAFVLVMGGDNIGSIERWYHGEEILRDFEIWVYPRPGYDAAADCARLSETTLCKGITLFEDAPQNDISSTRIRESGRRGTIPRPSAWEANALPTELLPQRGYKDSKKIFDPSSPGKERKRIEVVAAVIRRGDAIFATQRGYGEFKDWWEFPGGKIEAGETPRNALRREIREELDAEIKIVRLLKTIEWDYPAFHLTLHCFLCTLRSEALHLNEHEASAWLHKDELSDIRWLPADLQLISILQQLLA